MRHAAFAFIIPVAVVGFAAGCKKDDDDGEDVDATPTVVVSNTQGNVNDTPPDDDPDVKEPIDKEVPPVATVSLVVDCTGMNCGAADEATYSGSGVGVWRYENTGNKVKTVDVSLNGVNGKEITLVVTNLKSTAVDLPDYSANNSSAAIINANTKRNTRAMTLPGRLAIPFKAPYEVKLQEAKKRPNRNGTFPGPVPAPLLSSVGDTRTFNHYDDLPHATTLKQIETAADGTVVQVWVEDSEYDMAKVTDAMINQFATTFTNGVDAVYPMVTEVAGAPWGVPPYTDLIDAAQPIDIVLLDFNNDDAPWGTVGYFWARNNFKVETDPLSNESLSFYLDTETLYLAPDPAEAMQFEISTLAHEFVHMINFYQRIVLLDNGFDTWAEEMSAMMMEDVVSERLDPTYNTIRDSRFPGWLSNSTFNCSLTDWQSDPNEACFGYDVAGSFGGHLLRHFGVAFYQSFLAANTSATGSADLLDEALVTAGSSLKDEVRRWGAASALMPVGASPDGFGMTGFTELGHTLPDVYQAWYDAIRIFPEDGAELQPLGHFPMTRLPTEDEFTEFVEVPPGAALTVVVK